MNKNKLKKSILDNGLKLITYEVEGDIFSIGLAVKVGSLYENRKTSGISHLIEHMLFKGTKNRSIDEFNSDLEELATEMDIYTSYDQTVLSIDVIKSKSEKALEVISDMIINPSFDEKEFNLEKKVVLEEIKMGEDDPEDLAYQGLYKEAYPSNWYNYYIAGDEISVKGIKRNDAINHHKKYYVPNNSLICVVSSYPHEKVLENIEKYFGSWEKGEELLLSDTKSIIPCKTIRESKEGISQAHIIYAFDISKLTREESIILTLLSEKIGSGGNSILFKELRDKRGLAYSVYSDIDFMRNLKMLYLYAGVSIENVNETCEVIEKIVYDIKNSFNITEKSLDLLKERFIIDTEVALQSSQNMIDYILQGEIEYSNPLEYLNVLEIMKKVTIEELKNICKKVFTHPLTYILMPSE